MYRVINKPKIMSENKFSILIPTWNNLEYFKLCIKSIRKNSHFQHQIIVHVNDGSDGTLEWLANENVFVTHSEKNIGICWSLNGMRSLVETEYIVYMNDDMYVCPDWDLELWKEIKSLPDNKFYFSSTMIQPRPFFCKSVISSANYGQSIEDFDEKRLLKDYQTHKHKDWEGGTWPPNIVHRDIWDLVGGYSIDFSPGLYSDPDFSAKLWMAGVRLFKGINKSRVFHFEARSTGRIKKNDGSSQFLYKWYITSSTFLREILHRGTPYPVDNKHKCLTLKNIIRNRFKRPFIALFKPSKIKDVWKNFP